ncbi:unnamed protein product [Closterium sp. NIES-65]|nr:unnamed protein product [Closterium sp. NIES-65]
MATTSGVTRGEDTVINSQTVSPFREASSVTVALLPPHPPKLPHAEALDEEERRRPGAESKERAAECSVSIPAARGPLHAATTTATAGVRRDEADPVYCFPQRDSAWAAALAACIALLIVHELVSPLFALQWPFLFSLAFFLLCSVSAFVLSLFPSCFALRRLSSNFTPRAVTVSAFMCEWIGTASAISCAGTATLLLAVFASMSAYSSLGAGMAAALASGLVAWIAALALCFLYCLLLPISATARLSFLPSSHIALRALSRAFPTFLLFLAVSLVLLLPVAVVSILVVGCGGVNNYGRINSPGDDIRVALAKNASKAGSPTAASGIVVQAQDNGWMDESAVQTWLSKEVLPHLNPQRGQNARRAMLVLDSYRGQITQTMLQSYRTHSITPAVIPAGCTSQIQPLDVSINRCFKAAVRARYARWFMRNLQRPPHPVVLQWIAEAWDQVPKQIIIDAFRHCGISSKLDGTENHLVMSHMRARSTTDVSADMSVGGTTGDNTRLLGRAPEEEEEEEAMQAEGVREVAVATGLEVLYQETPNYRGAAAEVDRMIEPRETARHA